MLKTLSLISLAILLSSCSAYLSDYERPSMPYLNLYAQAYKFTGNNIAKNYWQEFSDKKLDDLVNKALLNNFDLNKACLNVQKALIAVDISGTQRHPTANASLGVEASRALDYHQSMQKKTKMNVGLSYQIDLFGKIEALNQKTLQMYKATAYDYLTMRLTVIEAVANAYWQYAFAKEALNIATLDLDDSNKRLKFVLAKYAQGAANSLDVSDAKINHLKVQRALDAKYDELQKAKTALALLEGEDPAFNFDIGSLDDAVLPEFSLDIPAKLLEHRPDLMAKEATLKSFYSQYDEAKLAFFPDITFSSNLNLGSATSFARFFSDPIGALGTAITLPFLNFNELSLREKSALKDIDIAKLDFTSSYIKAVSEVYDAVSSIDFYKKEVVNTKKQYDLSFSNYNLYFTRYKSGLVSLSDFLDASDIRRSSHMSYLQSKRNLLQATMTLMSALGGDTPYMQKP